MARRRRDFGYIIPAAYDAKRRPLPPFKIRWREGTKLKKKSGFKTQQEAQDALARIRVGLSDGTLVEKRRASIGFDKVAQEWLRLHSQAALRGHAMNEMNYRIHVEPFFGDCPLSAMTASRILELRAHLQAKVRTRKRRDADGELGEREYKLSARTVNLVMALVRSIFRFAVANGHLASAPTEKLGRGRLMLKVDKAKLAPPIERAEDVGRLLETIREKRPDRYAMFATFLYTGMRKGEVCGLTWDCVDFARRIFNVRRSYSGFTKSAQHREVPMPSSLVPILQAHKLAEPYQGELVFPNDRGAMYTKNGKLEDILHAALARVGLKQIRIHDLRHVYASHFLMAGGNIFDLQKNLGHHSVAFTAAVYGHLSQDHRVRESDRLSGLFAAPPTAKVLAFEAPDGTKRPDSARGDSDDLVEEEPDEAKAK
jgi:integrase